MKPSKTEDVSIASIVSDATHLPRGLHYCIPKGKGIQRERTGTGFRYLNGHGEPITDEAVLERIRSLVLPPAYTSVWISPDPHSHIQAVGYDVRGRKQYRYHPDYRKLRDNVKFNRMSEFGKALRRIRRIVGHDLGRPGMPKRKVLASIVRLLETTYIRIGNEEYAKSNESFGLTTLRNDHVKILGEVMRFKFRGKSGQSHEISLADRRLASVIRKIKCLPGSSLFQYLDEEGQVVSIESGDVNEYLREISRGDFTAKDFRTWGGTCLATSYLLEKGPASTQGELKSVLVEVVKDVAQKLGNKPATCRKYYIHPDVLELYSQGTLGELASKHRHAEHSAYLYEDIVLAMLTMRNRSSKSSLTSSKSRYGGLRKPSATALSRNVRNAS